jgi:hypothetical protein
VKRIFNVNVLEVLTERPVGWTHEPTNLRNVQSEVEGEARWGVDYKHTFLDLSDETLWQFSYFSGNENDCSDFLGGYVTHECTQVFPHIVTTVVYRKAPLVSALGDES